MIKNKRIFVTGGAGVIGIELISILHNLGAKLLVGDLKPRPIVFQKEIQYRKGDLNLMTQDELLNFNPEIVIHLAASFERTEESYQFWNESFHHNIRLTHHIIKLSNKLKSLERFIFTSSYLVYDSSRYLFNSPQKNTVFIGEDFPIKPRNIIGTAKYFNETELLSLNSFKEINYDLSIIRIFRGYGKNSRCVISRWVKSILNNKSIDLYRDDGIFDYIFSRDSAECIVKVIESNFAGIVNLGSGHPYKIRDVIRFIQKNFKDIKINKIEKNIPYEASCSDNSKLYNDLGWKPQFSLEQGINEIIKYEKDKYSNT